MKAKKYLPIVLTSFIWGMYYVATKFANAYDTSPLIVGIFIRFFAFILLTLLMIKRKEIKSLFRVKGVFYQLALIGLLGFALDITAFMGFKTDAAVYGIVLLKCNVLIVNVISAIFFKKKFTFMDWIYTLIMLIGVVLVMDIDIGRFKLGTIGNLYFILSALFVSINAFVIKGIQHNKKVSVSNNVIAYYNNFVTMIFFIIFALVSGDLGSISNVISDTSQMGILLIAGVGQTLVYIFYYDNLKHYQVWIVNVFLLLMPVFALLILFVFFGETLLAMQYIGMFIVLFGAIGIILEQRKKKTVKDDI